MARQYFGTDGVRGVANQKLTPELAFSLGTAVGTWLAGRVERGRVCIGRDTRRSGSMLEAALAAGLCSRGIEVVRLGIAPTPTVAFAARTAEFDLGAIISASHNPAPDNGIKFVTHEGKKTSDELEETFESLMKVPSTPGPIGVGVGTVTDSNERIEAYLEDLRKILPNGLDGLRVAVDAANGAAYELAPRILDLLGARVSLMGVSPDGMNINAEGGATKPQAIQSFTVQAGADVGVAFDGDADRAIFSDRKGNLINGDRTIGMWAANERSKNALTPPIVVGTVMSNGGFESYMSSLGILVARAPVGDKYVSQLIESTEARIGGEQSGHIIFPQHGPTGDGLVTMLELLKALTEMGGDSAMITEAYDPWPQLLVNVGVATSSGWKEAPHVSRSLSAGETALEGKGRIVVRPSGTQPMIRVMVEADDIQLRDRVADEIVAAMEQDLGGEVHGRVDLTYALGD